MFPQVLEFSFCRCLGLPTPDLSPAVVLRRVLEAAAVAVFRPCLLQLNSLHCTTLLGCVLSGSGNPYNDLYNL